VESRNRSEQDQGIFPREVAALLKARERLIASPPSLELERSVPYRQGFALGVPPEPGIYLFHDFRGVIYVGQSDSLRRRFDEHFWERDNPLLARALARPVGEMMFSWIRIPLEKLDEAERRLVRAFHPLCNRVLYLSAAKKST
jgi:hypothetical protein